MRFSIIKFLQFIFRLIMIFMLVFVWVRYYSTTLNFAVWLSAFITLVIEVILKIIKNKRLEKLGLKQNEIQIAQSLANKLMFNSKNENLSLFYKILQSKEDVKKHKDYLMITNQKGDIFALFPAFSYSDFSVDNLADCFQKVKKHNLKRLIICTKSSTKEAKEISKKASFEVLILEFQEVYAKIFKAYNYTPKEEELFKIENVSKEIKFKDIAKGAISPNKTKPYFFSSLVLLLASYFVPYKIYYYTIASLLLVLSIASFTSVWWKKQVVKDIF